jgi:hypothetical protein
MVRYFVFLFINQLFSGEDEYSSALDVAIKEETERLMQLPSNLVETIQDSGDDRAIKSVGLLIQRF